MSAVSAGRTDQILDFYSGFSSTVSRPKDSRWNVRPGACLHPQIFFGLNLSPKVRLWTLTVTSEKEYSEETIGPGLKTELVQSYLKKTKFFCKSSNQTISIKKKNNNNFLALLWDIVGQNIPVRSDYLRTGIISQFTVSLIYDLRSDNKLAHGNVQHTKQTGLNVFIRKIGKSSFSYLYMCSCDTWWSAHLRGQCRAASQRNTVWDLGQLLVFLLHSYVILIVTLNKQFIPCTITIPIYASNIRKLQKQVRTKVSGLME